MNKEEKMIKRAQKRVIKSLDTSYETTQAYVNRLFEHRNEVGVELMDFLVKKAAYERMITILITEAEHVEDILEEIGVDLW